MIWRTNLELFKSRQPNTCAFLCHDYKVTSCITGAFCSLLASVGFLCCKNLVIDPKNWALSAKTQPNVFILSSNIVCKKKPRRDKIFIVMDWTSAVAFEKKLHSGNWTLLEWFSVPDMEKRPQSSPHVFAERFTTKHWQHVFS